MAQLLSREDVPRLMAEPTARSHAETVGKIAAAFDEDALGAADRTIAAEIFKTLVHDTAQVVREALVAELKKSKDIPVEEALAFAKDVDAVALAMLREEDLLEIVGQASPARQSAVA